MKNFFQSKTLSTGLAMFSMFFGAGNVVFPLALGQITKGDNFFAILGLLITAIAVPFLGLIAMILYHGNYKNFFGRLGKAPGFVLALFIMCLIGPFGAMPRCIALSHSTLSLFIPNIPLLLFSFISILIIFIFTYKESKLIEILGNVLTPFLLLALGVIIAIGLFSQDISTAQKSFPLQAFIKGLGEGYYTMDLLASFFFCAVIIDCLKANFKEEHQEYKKITLLSLKASMIGAFLLSVIYIGFSFVAARNSTSLEGISTDFLLAKLSINILGPYAGIVASAAVALACLTTAVALASAFANFLSHEILNKKLNYVSCLVITLIITLFISTLNFSGIAKILTPILSVCYPSLIVLSACNLFHKLYGFSYVKLPVFSVFILNLILYTYINFYH